MRWLTLGALALLIGAMVWAALPAAAQSAPANPTNLTTTRTVGQIVVSWDAVTGATGYNLVISQDGKHSWTRVVDGENITTKTITGLDNTLVYHVSVQAVNAHGSSAWVNSPAIYTDFLVLNPPASVTISSHTPLGLTVSWDTVTSAQGYNVNLTANGGLSWTRVSSGVTGTSLAITTANFSAFNGGATYIAAVQSVHSGGGVGWRNSASSSPTYSLSAPASVTAYRGDNFIDVEWPHVTGATGYDVNYAFKGANWTRAVSNQSGGTGATRTVRISSVPNQSWHVVAVRARTSSGLSRWTNSAHVNFADYPLPVTGLTVERTVSGEIDVSWDVCDTTAWSCTGGSPITKYAINLSDDGGFSWTRAATVAAADYTSGDSVTLRGVTDSTAYRVAVAMRTRVGGKWVNANVGPYVGLTASDITTTSATLTIAGHTDSWRYKANAAPDNACSATAVSAGTSTTALTGLSPGTSYTYSAYSDSSCATLLVTVVFSTLALGDRNSGEDITTISDSSNNDPTGIWSDGTTMWVADDVDDKLYAYKMSDLSRDSSKDFNTLSAAGNNNPRGIWADGTTMWVMDADDYRIYAYKMSDKSTDTGKEFDLQLAEPTNVGPTGIWSDGTTMWVGDHYLTKVFAYKMSDQTRDSGKDFNTLSAAGNTNPAGIWSDGTTAWIVDDNSKKVYAYKLSDKSRDASKDFDTLDAAGNDNPWGIWSDGSTTWIADDVDDKLYAYYPYTALLPTVVGSTMATLTLNGYSGDWWLKKTAPTPAGTCTVGESDFSHALTALTANTTYTYKAYDTSNCASADEIGETTFATVSVGDRNAAQDVNTVFEAGNTFPKGVWSNGTTMWVADATNDKLYAYKMSDKSRDASKDFNTLSAAGNNDPRGIWSNGTTMWVADEIDKKLYAYKMSDKSRDAAKDFATLDAADNDDPQGIWSDGTTMWVADRTDSKLYAYKMSDKSRDAAKDFNTLNAAGNNHSDGIGSDGTTMWVADYLDDKLYAYKVSDKSRDATKDITTVSDSADPVPTGIWTDGITIWVIEASLSDTKIYAYYA